MIGEGRKERRAPVDLQHVVNEHGVVPSGAAILEADLIPALDVILNTGIDLITDTERSEVNDWLRRAVHVVVGMVVVIIDGQCCQDLERLWIRVEQVDCRPVGVGEDASSSLGCGLDTVEELNMGRVLKVQQVGVEAQIGGRVCGIDGLWNSTYYNHVSSLSKFGYWMLTYHPMCGRRRCPGRDRCG